MSRRISYIIVLLLSAVSCRVEVSDPYAETLRSLAVSVTYPEGYESFLREGVAVSVEDINLGSAYSLALDASGKATFRLPEGLYRVSVSDRSGADIFNATADRFVVSGSDATLSLSLKHTKAGTIVIKEIYCGGCLKAPEEGNYQADKYVILHNNDVEVQYLDSLAFGYTHPYNATASNPFLDKDSEGRSVFKDYVAIADAVWMFPGDGTTFPLQPGEDAVIAINGAIDHTVSFPLSVNLDREEYFVTYNANYFTNQTYHPVPGAHIRNDHILECLVKTGVGNALAFSISSPAVVLYKAKGTSLEEYVAGEGVIPIPGSVAGAKVLACPLDWVLDAVEVFDGRTATNAKRFPDTLDAGYVSQSDIYLGHSLMRRTDEELSEASGFEVLMDTNNSSADFYERESQSLHE